MLCDVRKQQGATPLSFNTCDIKRFNECILYRKKLDRNAVFFIWLKGSEHMGKGRSTVYNSIVTPEKLAEVNPNNRELAKDFLDYLRSVDRSPTTIYNYNSDLNIFWVWNLEHNNNKYFIKLTKREIAKFQSFGINELGWSSNRVRRVKSCLSSLSNYIENILDEEEEFAEFRSIIRKIENPAKEVVREKTILTTEQVEYLLDELVRREKYQCACAVALAAYCGCRKAEICRFKVHYFDESNLVNNAYYVTPEKIKTKGHGAKLGKPLIKYTLVEFKKYFDLWMAERKRLGIESEWLFVSKEGDGYVQAKISTMDSYAATCCAVLNVPFYFHCLRHYLTTLMNSKHNLPSKVVQEWNGWSAIEMLNIYDDSEASDTFGDFFTENGIKTVEKASL